MHRLALLTVCCACACGAGPAKGDGGPPEVGEWPAGAFELGSWVDGGGVPRFVPFPAVADLVPGAQGGYHVEVMYRVSGALPAETVLFTHHARLLDGGTLVSRGSRRWSVETDGGTWESETFPVFLCPTPLGVSVLNESITLEVKATRGDGGLLGTVLGTTLLRCEAGQYCEVICKG